VFASCDVHNDAIGRYRGNARRPAEAMLGQPLQPVTVGVLVHVSHDQACMQRARIRQRQARNDAQRLRIFIHSAQAQ